MWAWNFNLDGLFTNMTRDYNFQTKVWLYPGEAAWHFVTLPVEVAQDIEYYFAHLKKGWGSLPVSVTCEKVTWQTSIFPDKKSSSYLLPLKAKVRQQANIKESDTIKLKLVITG